MVFVVALFGSFIAALGAVGVVAPARLVALVAHVQSPIGLYAIAGIRLVLGVSLLLVAAASRAPLYLQILGGLSLISGILTPFFGVRRFEAILDWWRRLTPWIVRLWCLLVVLFGASMVWAILPGGPA